VRYWVPWLAADGTVYDGGQAGYCGEPPEATNGQTAALPSNETYGVTGLDGTGSTEFDMFDATENATLGCSASVACSLVAVRSWASIATPTRHRHRRRPISPIARRAGRSRGSLAIGSPPDFPYNLTVSGACGGAVELAQPHHRPAQLRLDAELVSHRELQQHH